eukprot:g1070.t1
MECVLMEWKMDFTPLLNKTRNSESGESVEFMKPSGHYGGYYFIDGTSDGHMFYLYFENRYHDPEAPLVFWTNGGPGCSSFFGLFLENGPYMILDDLSLQWNPHGWDIGQNLIFVEQPLNVGFSYSGDVNDTVTREEQVAEHMLQFFYAFFKEHPELTDKDFYLTGESFAGHYLPVIAGRILRANSENPEIEIKLKGLAMGDPWTDPSLQFQSYPVYEYEMGLIDINLRDKMMEEWKFCDHDLKYCNSSSPEFSKSLCIFGYEFCNSILFSPVFSQHPILNYYDIRKGCYVDGCYDVSKLIDFMNLPYVKKQFDIPKGLEWRDCSDPVYFDMLWDVGTNVAPLVSQLLDQNLQILVYVGDQDLICNYIGNRAWIDEMQWQFSKEWKQAADYEWIIRDRVVGEIQSNGPLTFIKVKESGHMVPMDQPVVSLEMISIFTHSQKKWILGKKVAANKQESFCNKFTYRRVDQLGNNIVV